MKNFAMDAGCVPKGLSTQVKCGNMLKKKDIKYLIWTFIFENHKGYKIFKINV